MADNSSYPFGLDFYEGNSVRDWSALSSWSSKPAFAYFRLGIGLHVDKPDLRTEAQHLTTWDIGQFYEVWLTDVPKDAQLQVVKSNLDKSCALPLAFAFEEQVYIDKKGNRIPEWPSVGDLQYLLANMPGSICYTSLAGLDLIKTTLGAIPSAWKFWIARYLDQATLEAPVTDTLTLLQSKYGITADRVLFMQTSQAGAYPQGASYDKGADYDRMVSFKTIPEPPPTPLPVASSFKVTPANGLIIRSDPSISPSNIVGGVFPPATVYGEKTADGNWIKLGGYVSAQFVSTPAPTPTPVPTPTPTPSPLPVGGEWLQVLHDQDMPPEFLPRMLQRGYAGSLPQNVGVPEIVNLENGAPIPLGQGEQNFIYQNMRMADPGGSIPFVQKAFTSVLGSHEAFANGTGFPTKDGDDPHANLITGENSGAPLPKLDRPRITGGNVVLAIDKTVYQVNGVPCRKVLTLKAGAMPLISDVNFEKTPWLVFRCTTVTPFPVDPNASPERYRCNPFPQLGGVDVPMPLITVEGFGFIPVDRLRPIPDPFAVSPYVP